jgi:hypothetical protein
MGLRYELYEEAWCCLKYYTVQLGTQRQNDDMRGRGDAVGRLQRPDFNGEASRLMLTPIRLMQPSAHPRGTTSIFSTEGFVST